MYYYTLIAIFSVIVFMMSVDKNVADYLILSIKFLKLNIERWIWMLINHPNNNITTWWRMRKYRQFVREFKDTSQTVQNEND